MRMNLNAFKFLDCVDYKLSLFNTFVNELINKHVPLIIKVIKRPLLAWINSEIKVLIRNRNRLYRSYRRTKNSVIYAQFTKLRKDIMRKITKNKANYLLHKFTIANN